jgi:hypothetical protein
MEVTEARYPYDTYDNVVYQSFTRQNRYVDSNTTFAYNDRNQVTAIYGPEFGWRPLRIMASLGGATYSYAAGHPHAVKLVNGVKRDDWWGNPQ